MSLLDLHFNAPNPGITNKNTLEIFEAGTGHGALTLHLARAIHGANTRAPAIPLEGQTGKKDDFHNWCKSRNAVIQTLDISSHHSRHAVNVVQNYRSGIYFPHVNFHVGTISEYLSARLLESGGEPFLDHAILDLPNTHEYLEIVKKALKPNGTLITFCPSITQINASVMLVKAQGIALFLEKVLEVGAGIGVGGREWDVRPVKARALLKSEAAVLAHVGDPEAVVEGVPEDKTTSEPADAQETGWEMVCRPKVGLRTAGGGFLAVWRRKINHAEVPASL